MATKGHRTAKIFAPAAGHASDSWGSDPIVQVVYWNVLFTVTLTEGKVIWEVIIPFPRLESSRKFHRDQCMQKVF